MDPEKIKEVLVLHAKWRRGEPDGARANLARAYLAGAYLAGADLAGADLAGANLADADLAGAYLAGARNIPAGVTGASPPEPYRRSTNRLEHAQRYRARNPGVPVVENLDTKIMAAVSSGSGALDMRQWHTCETTHCRAGWAVHLAGEAGYALEKERGPRWAGAQIYRASTGRSPNFFADNESAMEDIRRCAAEESDGAK